MGEFGHNPTKSFPEASLSDNSFHVRIFPLHSPQASTYTDFQVLLYSSVVPVSGNEWKEIFIAGSEEAKVV